MGKRIVGVNQAAFGIGDQHRGTGHIQRLSHPLIGLCDLAFGGNPLAQAGLHLHQRRGQSTDFVMRVAHHQTAIEIAVGDGAGKAGGVGQRSVDRAQQQQQQRYQQHAHHQHRGGEHRVHPRACGCLFRMLLLQRAALFLLQFPDDRPGLGGQIVQRLGFAVGAKACRCIGQECFLIALHGIAHLGLGLRRHARLLEQQLERHHLCIQFVGVLLLATQDEILLMATHGQHRYLQCRHLIVIDQAFHLMDGRTQFPLQAAVGVVAEFVDARIQRAGRFQVGMQRLGQGLRPGGAALGWRKCGLQPGARGQERIAGGRRERHRVFGLRTPHFRKRGRQCLQPCGTLLIVLQAFIGALHAGAEPGIGRADHCQADDQCQQAQSKLLGDAKGELHATTPGVGTPLYRPRES
ncbi:hypothetical protein D3C81_1044280 [compost metagenome]